MNNKFQDIDFEKYAREMAAREGGLVRSPKHWIDQLAERLATGGKPQGDKLPWSKTFDHVRFRPGELSIHAGMSSHRKSMMLGWIMCNIAREYSSSVAIASLEMQPEETIFRMAQQCTGCTPSEDSLFEWIRWADDKIAIYDEVDKVKWNRIIGFVYFCAKELEISHIVIDSLTKCGIDAGNGVEEKDFTDRLQWAAKTLGCHIHLVCHMRKPNGAGDEYVPNKFDVRGASEITDLADNLFIHWMDKKRSKIIDRIDQFGVDSIDVKERDYLKNSCDQKLIVAKQRHGSFEGTFNLFFDRRSLQFIANEGQRHQFSYSNTYENAA